MARLFFLILFAVLTADAVVANPLLSEQDSVPQGAKTRLGFDLGWESPYSAGMELGVTIAETVDINGGVGLGLSGFKAGVGCRVYPMWRNKWSPMVSGHIFRASGLGEVTVTSNEDEALYRIQAATGFVVNVGLRCRMRNDDYFLFSLGRSWALEGGNAIYLDGSTSSTLESIANIMGVGGFSFNFSYLMRVGK